MLEDTNQSTKELTKIDPITQFDLINARLDSDEFIAERKTRKAMIDAARDYYEGNHPQPLKVRSGQYDPNIVINMCRRLIVKTSAWLVGDPKDGALLKMEVKENDQLQSSAEESSSSSKTAPSTPASPELAGEGIDAGTKGKAEDEYLARVWEANGGSAMLMKLARRGSIEGHIFVKILPVGDPDNDMDVPMIVAQDGEMISVLRQAQNKERAEAFSIEWEDVIIFEGRQRKTSVRQVVARINSVWWVGKFAKVGKGKVKWVAYETPPQAWGYEWCPITDWQNLIDHKYYGSSDLEDLPTINNGVNFAVSNLNRILYIHGHPRTIGTGFEAGNLQEAGIDSFWTIANADAKVVNLEMQSDLGSAFSFIQFLTQSFYDIGRDLDLASLRDRIGQVTNFGLHVLSNDAINKLGEKRSLYGKGLNKINRIILELGGFNPRDTKIHWLDPLPEDGKEVVDSLKAEMEMKIVSRQTATEERGRDFEQERERMEEEAASESNIGAALLSDFDSGSTFKTLPRSNNMPTSPQAPMNTPMNGDNQ